MLLYNNISYFVKTFKAMVEEKKAKNKVSMVFE